MNAASSTSSPPRVLSPRAVSDRLGITTGALVALIRAGRYAWTELRPGGKPGARGPNQWGLTDAQLADILRGQERRIAEPTAGVAELPAAPPSPDGKSRLRRRRRL